MDEVIGKIHQPLTLEEMPRGFIFTQAEKVLGYISDGSRLQGAGFVPKPCGVGFKSESHLFARRHKFDLVRIFLNHEIVALQVQSSP